MCPPVCHVVGLSFPGVFVVGASLSLFIGNVRAGKVLHAGIMHTISRSPMSFFDTTPVGRILNRFGKDIDTIDTTIAQNFQMWITCMLRVIQVPIIVGLSTPLFLTTVIPTGIFYFLVQVSCWLSLLPVKLCGDLLWRYSKESSSARGQNTKAVRIHITYVLIYSKMHLFGHHHCMVPAYPCFLPFSSHSYQSFKQTLLPCMHL